MGLWRRGIQRHVLKKRKDTACGPSGITMQFYRMFCLDDELAEMHATFIELPFKYGFSLTRWQQSVHFMLIVKIIFGDKETF